MDELSIFLNQHKFVKTNETTQPTHTRIPDKNLGIYGGSYTIEGEDLNTFYNLMYEHIFVKGKKEYLTEKQVENGVIYVDLDFRYDTTVTTRQHNKQHVDDIMFCYIENLKLFLNFKDGDSFKVYVMEKPNVNCLPDKTKDGIHFIFGLNMPHSLQLKLRENVMKEIQLDLPITNDLDSIFDEGLSKGSTNTQLFGCQKPANEAYELTGIFECVYDYRDKEFSTLPVEFDMPTQYKELCVKSDVIRPSYPINKKWENVKAEKVTKAKPTKKIIIEKEDCETDSEKSETGDFIETDVYYKYLNCIGSKMCGRGQHLDTINVLQALKNEDCDKKYVEYWISTFCSPQSKKYSYALNHYINHIKSAPLSTVKRYSVKSLKNWAKLRNPELYGTYFQDDYEFQIKQKYNITNLITTSFDEMSIMSLVFDLIKKYVILDNDFIYLYYNDEWHKMNEKDCKMLKNLIGEIFVIYVKFALDIINLEIKNKLDDEAELKKLKELHKSAVNMHGVMKKNNYINNICTLLKNKLSTFKNTILFDLGEDNFYKIHFKNGVYDIKEKIFRSRTFNDYVTQYLPYDYKKEEEIEQEIKDDVLGFFKKIQPDEEQRKFTLSYLAYCLTGDASKQIFKMNIGHSASNGKSTEMSIHEICFELYSMKCDSRVLQSNFEKRHKFLNDLVYKPIRFLYFEELPKGKKLDAEFVKDFVDGKKLALEKMFGTTDKFKIQAKMMSASNHDFEFDTDEGILRRGRVQFYESKFTDENVDESKHIYKKEEGFENKFNNDDFKNAYFHLLLKHIDSLYVPNKNKEDFKQKAEESDTILNNILEYFEITNNPNDVVGKIEIEYKFGKEKFSDYKNKLQSKGCKYESQTKYWCEDEKKQKSGVFTNLKIK
jgi:hypothetical protein